MDKRKRLARSLGELVGKTFADLFARQGFAAMRIVTHWPEIAGPEIAAHAEPLRINWPKDPEAENAEPAVLVLRVEGPAAIEIQHLAPIIIERVNRFFGWPAVGRIALRQAPLTRCPKRLVKPRVDPGRAQAIAAGLTGVADDALRSALGRLGAAVKNEAIKGK